MVNIHLQAVNCCDFPKAFKFRRLMAIWWLGTSWGEADLETEPLTVRLPGITRAAFTLLDENQVFFTQGGHLCLGSCMTPFPSMKGNNHLSKIVKKGPTSRYFWTQKNWSQSFQQFPALPGWTLPCPSNRPGWSSEFPWQDTARSAQDNPWREAHPTGKLEAPPFCCCRPKNNPCSSGKLDCLLV